MTPPRPHHHHQAEGHDSAAEMRELLELDASVTGPLLDEITAWIRGIAEFPGGPRQIVDLGSGVGAAAVALAGRFQGAQVTAVDRSLELLAAVRARALEEGLADRIRTVEADLDGAWPELRAVDLVWSSLALHHLQDPDRGLQELHRMLRLGGLVAVVEMGHPLRLLPDALGRGEPGLEGRLLAAMAETGAAQLPSLGSDWGERLTRAGFSVVDRREFRIDRRAGSLSGVERRYGAAWLGRLLEHLGPSLRPTDREVLTALVEEGGPFGFRDRDDVYLAGSRLAWVARRP